MDNKSFSIARYAFQSFRHYGGKSVIFMIVLAVTLVLSLFNISTSLQSTVYEQAVTIGGDAQFKYDNVTPEQIETVKSQKQVEWTSEYVYFSNLWITAPDRDGSESTAGLAYIENLEQMEGFKLKSGIIAQKENEVVIPTYVAEYLGIEAKAGVEFEVFLNSRDSAEASAEVIQTPVKFTVSGIMQDNGYFEMSERYYIFTSKEFVSANAKFKESDSSLEQYNSLDVFVKLKKGYEAKTVSVEIAEIIGIEYDNIQYNNFYLAASLNNAGDRIMFYVIIGFFAFVGALIIYNAFNIIIAKRTRHLGMLTLIGASKKQIRKCVYIEALLNIAAALPVGLLLGTLAGWLVMPIVRASYDRVSTVYNVLPQSYLLTILITVTMVFAGAVIPARRAGKITPVEAAKFTPDSTKTRKIRSLKNITLTSLARINLFRKKGGAVGIITSLSIVGALFVSLSFVLFSVYGSLGNLARQSMAADIEIKWGEYLENGSVIFSYGEGAPPILPVNIVDKIINLNGVKEARVFYVQNYAPAEIETEYYWGAIIGADDGVMREILNNTYEKIGNLSLSDFKDKKINVIAVKNPYHYEGEAGYEEYHLGQDITVNWGDYYSKGDPAGQIILHIAGIADSREMLSYSFSAISNEFQTLIMPQNSFESNGFTLQCDSIFLNIDSSKYDSIAESLDKICEDEGNIHYKSFMKEKKQYETQMMSILILVMAGLGIVFLVGLLNLISTTFIGIEQRKKEIGVLSALGLGSKELKKMLRWEGVWVSLFSTVISIAGGFGIGCLFYAWVESMGANYIELSFPFLPLTIFCLVYIFTPFTITSVSVRKLLKNTTVELIGREI